MDVRRKDMMKVLLVIVYLILTISGLVLMKKGGNTGTIAVQNKEMTFGISIISALGLVCYVCSFLLYTKIVLMFNLSYITPICTGIVQVAVLIISHFTFNEHLSALNIIGASTVILGIILMNLPQTTVK